MNNWLLIRREIWQELHFGLKSGVVTLTFVGLVGYLMLVLTNAGYLQQMGAVDVPRNAPNLVYLMSSGDVFFLFFAWAWVFAQPIVRDRHALLHEIVYSTPVSLRALLTGRYLGALAVALLLGFSQMAGFIIAPVLEALGMVPEGSMGPTPWVALGWSFLIFLLPSAAGTGALYFVAALRTRSAAGPFAVSAALIAIWMFAMIVLSEGGILTNLASVLDPSSFADVDRLNKLWTPFEKANIVYPLTTPFLINRLVWCLIPVCFMALFIYWSSRENLVLEKGRQPNKTGTESSVPVVHVDAGYHPPALQGHWWLAFLSELVWQHRQLFKGRTFRFLMPGLIVMAAAAGLVHGINHVDGPFEARPELTAPLVNETLFLVIAFITAALAGHVLRRDHRIGIADMLDALPTPLWVTQLARVCTVLSLSLSMVLMPALGTMLLSLIVTPDSFGIVTPLVYALGIFGPGLMEVVAITVLLHCLIRRSGTAYAASMLVTFILVVNHEAELVTYPPLEFGIPAHIGYSLLTGWSAWFERLLIGDAYKLAFVLMLLSLAGIVRIRGLDSRLQNMGIVIWQRLLGASGAMLALSLVVAALLYPVMQNKFVTQGGYLSHAQSLNEDADWEQRWLSSTAPWSVSGGELRLDIDTGVGRIEGHWAIHGVTSENGLLHMELPQWLSIQAVSVDGLETEVDTGNEHVLIKLGSCAETGCEVSLSFFISPSGWNAEGDQAWMSAAGIWAEARDVVPRLGIDALKMIRSPLERNLHGLAESPPALDLEVFQSAVGVAPAGNWTLALDTDGDLRQIVLHDQPLDFTVFKSNRGVPLEQEGLTVWTDKSRLAQAGAVLEDTQQMQACVARRLGRAPELSLVAQRPRQMGPSVLAGGILLLAEDPNWDVAPGGTGHWQRQSHIAGLLAKDVLATSTDLRQGQGAKAFLSGVSGAIGQLCAGDTNGTESLQILLSRATERINQAIAASASPVGAMTQDVPESWQDEYAANANVPWVAQTGSEQFAELLAIVRESGSVEYGLASLLGDTYADIVLGIPMASDVMVSRQDSDNGNDGFISLKKYRWQSGGWTSFEDTSDMISLETGDIQMPVRKVTLDEAEQVLQDSVSSGQPMLMLDSQPAFERTPANNLAGQ